MIHETESDDVPQLSAETFAVLQEFYREQDEKLAQDVKGGTVEENWVILNSNSSLHYLIVRVLIVATKSILV